MGKRRGLRGGGDVRSRIFDGLGFRLWCLLAAVVSPQIGMKFPNKCL